jgi:hypothetical protein
MRSESEEWIKVDADNVLSEVIDGEVMIIDMRLGNYYSLSGVAVTIWRALSEPRRVEEVVHLVSREYSGDADEMSALIQRFVDDLVAEQLVAREAGTARGAPVRPPAAEVASEPKPPFQAPVLEKFTDMQALLLVDPIHDVDVLGWPRVKPT